MGTKTVVAVDGTALRPIDVDAAVHGILEEVPLSLHRMAFEGVASHVERIRQDGGMPPLTSVVELASETARPLAQFDAWILDKGQGAYAGIGDRVIRSPDDPCAFVWTDLGSSERLNVRQAAYKIQESCLGHLDEAARLALSAWANALIDADAALTIAEAADVSHALASRVEEYRQWWCEPPFKWSSSDDAWISCVACGANITHLNRYMINADEVFCVMCGESQCVGSPDE